MIPILAIMILVLGASTSSLAKTENFYGTMYYRVLNGAENNVFYSFEGDKNITMSGDIKVIDTTNYGGKPNTKHVCLYEKTRWGQGNKICEDSTVADYDGKAYSFYATGKTTNTSDKYYILCYKAADDGFDIRISGSLTTD